MKIRTVGIHEAKSNLPELLERVEAGETIAITRHGRQIALLQPVTPERAGTGQAISRLRRLRKGSRLRGLSVRKLRDEGRP